MFELLMAIISFFFVLYCIVLFGWCILILLKALYIFALGVALEEEERKKENK